MRAIIIALIISACMVAFLIGLAVMAKIVITSIEEEP